MLAGEGNADDGDEEQHPEEEVGDGYPNSADEDPNHIEQKVEAAAGAIVRDHLFAERPKGKPGQFKGLDTEGNAHDGDHQNQTRDKVLDRGDESAEDEPYKVSEKTHRAENREEILPQLKFVMRGRDLIGEVKQGHLCSISSTSLDALLSV